MRVTINLPDTHEAPKWDYDLGGAGDFLEEIEAFLFFCRKAGEFHRTCGECGAHLHTDLEVNRVGDCHEYQAIFKPQAACSRCQSTNIVPFVDPVFVLLDSLKGFDKERVWPHLNEGEEKVNQDHDYVLNAPAIDPARVALRSDLPERPKRAKKAKVAS